MQTEKLWNEFASLPAEAQQRVVDLITSLRAEYASRRGKRAVRGRLILPAADARDLHRCLQLRVALTQRLLRLLALADVLDLRDEMSGLVLIVSDERHAQQDPDLMAPGMPVPLLDLIGRNVPVEQIRHLTLVDVDVVRVREVAKRTRADLLRRVPGNPTQRVVDAEQLAGHVYQGHADRRVRERGFKCAKQDDNRPGAHNSSGARWEGSHISAKRDVQN